MGLSEARWDASSRFVLPRLPQDQGFLAHYGFTSRDASGVRPCFFQPVDENILFHGVMQSDYY
ncbi:hypothetical protein [Dictyobacter formicarum]|uniref:Uncharacterized protein n=1 Tax=Dictyobacter formicarum TaxID=2778368 RepID=A0ABQ3VWB8_9CHLR|nr:hypothetical protein [Dictyobacter formicarum]GHO89919.1 hypothetical protein KSZ_79250 [Dictyobacter formicarum]